MSKVDDAGHPEDQRQAQADDGIDASQEDSINSQLDEVLNHFSLPLSGTLIEEGPILIHEKRFVNLFLHVCYGRIIYGLFACIRGLDRDFEEVWDYRGAARASDKTEQEKLFFHFLNHGIFPSKLRINLSMPMRETEIHEFLNVFEDYVKKV
jgi:glutamate-1-semialdehyde aminotransferase